MALRLGAAAYAAGGLASVLTFTRTAVMGGLVLLFGLSRWGIGELFERALTSEGQDAS